MPSEKSFTLMRVVSPTLGLVEMAMHPEGNVVSVNTIGMREVVSMS